MEKKGFVLYKQWRHLFACLPADKCAELINAVFAYQCGEEPIVEDVMLRAIYNMMVEQFLEDEEKYEEIAKKRSKSAKKRWEPTSASESKSMQVDANASNSIQKDANDADKVLVLDKGLVLEEGLDKGLDKKTPLRLSNDNLPPRGTETKPVPQKRFVPPTVEEVRDYCIEKGYDIDPEDFVAFYQSKGWMVGKNHMKDWKAATRTWVQRRKKEQKPDRLDGIRRWAEKGGGYDERRVCNSGYVDQGGVYESFS